ncbi:MAG: hypothetical protein QOH31_3968 [Verrucomicrobiota bacterium]
MAAYRRIGVSKAWFKIAQGEALGAVIKPVISPEGARHRKTFEEEFWVFLKHYRVAFDERYVWDLGLVETHLQCVIAGGCHS